MCVSCFFVLICFDYSTYFLLPIYLFCVGCIVKQFSSHRRPHFAVLFRPLEFCFFAHHLLFGSFSLARMGSYAFVTGVGVVGIVFREKETYFPGRPLILLHYRWRPK